MRRKISYPVIFYLLLIFWIKTACAEEHLSDTNAETIPEIEVREGPVRDGISDNIVGLKANIPNKDTPLSIESIETEILANSRIQSLETLIDGNSLANSSPDNGNTLNGIILRGFTDTSFQRNGLNNSFGTLPVRDLANIASVEILKGASSALYGTGEPGGTINYITKQPEFEAQHSLQFGLGNYNRYRIELDSTSAISDVDNLAYRMIAAYEKADSFRDFIDSKRIFASPSIKWKPNDKLEVQTELEYISHKVPFDSGILTVDGRFPLPHSQYLGEPDLEPTRLQGVTATVDVDYITTKGIDISASLQWQNTDIESFENSPVELEAAEGNQRFLIRELQKLSDLIDVFSAQLEIGRNFEFAGHNHLILGGYEHVSSDNKVIVISSDVEDELFEIDIFNPNYGQPLPTLSPLEIIDEFATHHSLYLQDFLTISPSWKVLLGARLDMLDINTKDKVNNINFIQNNDELSFRVGLLFSPTEVISLFSNYSESIDPNGGLKADGTPLIPKFADSIEGGVKIQFPVADFTFDASVYRIEQLNIPVDDPNNPGFELQATRQLSKGLDLNLSIWPTKQIRTSVKYANTNAVFKDDLEIPDGTRPFNVPVHKIVLSGLYYHTLKNENDLLIGANIFYKSKQNVGIEPEEINIIIPGHWVGNFFMDYLLSSNISVGLDVNNIFNNDYLAGSQGDLLHIMPGTPFTILAKLKISF